MITETIKNVPLQFNSNSTIFSPHAIDKGTLLMLSHVEFTAVDKVLDLGCGYGVVGILAAKIIGPDKVAMCDISEDAVALSHDNAVLNGVENIKIIKSDGLVNVEDGNYTIILSNPPYHTDFSVAKNFIEQSFKKLSVGGRMLMVTKRLDWYKNKLTSVFGGVKVFEEDGYFTFIAEKRQNVFASKQKKINKAAVTNTAASKNTLSKKLQRKYKI